jgi:hypothetical protein
MHPAKRLCVAVLAFAALAPLPSVQAQDVFVGSWVLDPATSSAPPGLVPTAGPLEITAAGDGKYTSISEATMGGVEGRSEVTFSIDGKDYATTSTPAPPGGPSVTQAIERVSDSVYKISVKVDGQLIATALNEISGDGNTLTQTTTGIGQFATLSSTMVFRRK